MNKNFFSRSLIIFVLVFSFLFLFLSNAVFAQEPLPPPPPPAPPVRPLDGTVAILNSDFSLTLQWQEVAGVDAYQAQYWKEGGSPVSRWIYRNPDGTLDEGFSIDYGTFEFGARYLWQVRSCADLNGSSVIEVESECGNYSDPAWSFTYPEIAAIDPPNKDNISFPDKNPGQVEVDWLDVTGAKSYLIDIKVDIGGCKWYNYVFGFFTGGSCDPIRALSEKVSGWVLSWFGLVDIKYDPSCPWVLWDANTGECNPIPVTEKEEESEFAKSFYKDDACVFSKGEKYKIRIASCLDGFGDKCGHFSEEKIFTVNDKFLFDLPAPKPTGPVTALYDPGDPNDPSRPEQHAPVDPTQHPEDIPTVGKKHSLQWEAHDCSNYIRIIVKDGGGKTVITEEIPSHESLELDKDPLKSLLDNEGDLNKLYSWQLQSCWRIGKDIKCEESKISTPWYFKTIGLPPILSKPENGGTVKIPVSLEWQPIDGAGSYLYQVATDSNFSDIKKEDSVRNSSSAKIDYPDITTKVNDKIGNTFWWRVKTCANEDGKVCGKGWSEERSFQTYPINLPTNPRPAEGSLPAVLSWDPDPGANFYQYKVKYAKKAEEETLEECVERDVIGPAITSQPSIFLSEICLGEYQWRVRSCLDKNCVPEVSTDWSPVWTFTAVEPPAPPEKGIVPCGRKSDNPFTPYNEREPCQLKHAGFLLQNILDFLLWRLGLMIMAILTVASAVISYFSLGSPTAISQIKLIWKSAGVGYGIIFLAWTFINLLLSILGFQAKFFGNWWQLPF